MLLALLALAVLAAALLLPALVDALRARRAPARRVADRAPRERIAVRDPGRERRAEQRARELLRSCVTEEEWAMYRELGFIRVRGRSTVRSAGEAHRAERATPAAGGAVDEPSPRTHPKDRSDVPLEPPGDEHPYAYLIYPHKPIVAFEPATRRLLSEY